MSDQVLRVADVAQLLGCSEDSILRDIRAGALAAMRRPRGRAFLIHRDALDAYFRDIRYMPAGRRLAPARKAINAERRKLRAIAGGRA